MNVLIIIIRGIFIVSVLSGCIAGIIDLTQQQSSTAPSIHIMHGPYEKYIKRPLDCFLATAALIVLSPLLCIVAILVKIKLGSPIIFKQERPGKNEKTFKLYKFRSMTDETDSSGNLMPNEVRLTTFGKKLRATSIDELPELINIVKGDMAIIGPRPLLVRYLPYYHDSERKRHNVRPGLTGLAQITKNGNLDWNEKLAIDVEYSESITFAKDFGIILGTIRAIFVRGDTINDGFDPLDVERKDEI